MRTEVQLQLYMHVSRLAVICITSPCTENIMCARVWCSTKEAIVRHTLPACLLRVSFPRLSGYRSLRIDFARWPASPGQICWRVTFPPFCPPRTGGERPGIVWPWWMWPWKSIPCTTPPPPRSVDAFFHPLRKPLPTRGSTGVLILYARPARIG